MRSCSRHTTGLSEDCGSRPAVARSWLRCPHRTAGQSHRDTDRRRKWPTQSPKCHHWCQCYRWRATGCWSAYQVSTRSAGFHSNCCYVRGSSNDYSRTCGSPGCRSSRWCFRWRCRRRRDSSECWRRSSASCHRRSSGCYPPSSVHSAHDGSTSQHSPPCCSGCPSAQSGSYP